MPSQDAYGSQPPLELLRQWINHKYWSELQDTSKIELVDLLFIGAMSRLGGHNFIPQRFYHHCFVYSIDELEKTTVTRIFSAISEWHFTKGYADKVALLSKVGLLTILD